MYGVALFRITDGALSLATQTRRWCHTPNHTLATHVTDPHTNKNGSKNKQPRKRKRVMPYIFGNDRLEELLWRLLDDRDPLLRAYVYPIRDDRKDDAVYIGPPFQGLIAWLRNEPNGGPFHIIIRPPK